MRIMELFHTIMELLWVVYYHDCPFHVIVTPCIFPLKGRWLCVLTCCMAMAIVLMYNSETITYNN